MSLEILEQDISAMNNHFLVVCARHQDIPEQLSLRLNVSLKFIQTIREMPVSSLAKAAELGQFLLQPIVDSDALRESINLPLDQGRAHLRSASRLKHVPPR